MKSILATIVAKETVFETHTKNFSVIVVSVSDTYCDILNNASWSHMTCLLSPRWPVLFLAFLSFTLFRLSSQTPAHHFVLCISWRNTLRVKCHELIDLLRDVKHYLASSDAFGATERQNAKRMPPLHPHRTRLRRKKSRFGHAYVSYYFALSIVDFMFARLQLLITCALRLCLDPLHSLTRHGPPFSRPVRTHLALL